MSPSDISAVSGKKGSSRFFSQSVDGSRDRAAEPAPRVRLRIDANPSVMALDRPRILLGALRLPTLDLPPDPSRLTPTHCHWKLRSSSARMSRRERFTFRRDGPRPIMPRSARGTARIRGPVSRVPPRRTAVIECADSSSSSGRGPNACPERACHRHKYHRTHATPVANPSFLNSSHFDLG